MSEYITVASVAEIAAGSMRLVEVDDRLVILSRIGDDYYCIDDICTHDGGTLSDGPHEGCEIACPRHGAKFDLRNGRALSMPATQDTVSHQVKVEDGSIRIRLNES
jgi:3-phenylpropionate/trans-cinnamate dioxygenase ferredoxin subunit|tara:strand:- start:777 stop:1094 length:318 start_codon:yes stop_codon:yes gene_type:complete